MKKFFLLCLILFSVFYITGCNNVKTEKITIDQTGEESLLALYSEEDFQNEKLEDYYLQCFLVYNDYNSSASYLHFFLDYPFIVDFAADFDVSKGLQKMADIRQGVLSRYGDSIEFPDKEKCYGYSDFENIHADLDIPNYWDSFYFKYCNNDQMLLSFPEPIDSIYNIYDGGYGQDISAYKYYMLKNNELKLWEPLFPIKKESGLSYVNKVTYFEPDSYGLVTIGFGEQTTEPYLNFVSSDNNAINIAEESMLSGAEAVTPSFSADDGIVAWKKVNLGMNNSNSVGIIEVMDTKNDKKYEISYSDWSNLYILGIRNGYLYVLNNLQVNEKGGEVADLNIINLDDMSRSVIDGVFENAMQPITISPNGRYIGYNKIDGNSVYGNKLLIYDLYTKQAVYSAKLPTGSIAPVWLSKSMIDSLE